MNVLIAVFLVLLFIAAALAQDFAVFSWDFWETGKRSEIVRNLGLLAAAVIGLGVGSWRAYTAYRQTQASQDQAAAATEQARAANEQARIAEQGHFTERFSRAAEQLGSRELPVRLGGIYALWRLTEDSSLRDVISTLDILCAFVRDPPFPHKYRPEPDTHEGEPAVDEESKEPPKLRPDVQAVLKLLGHREAPYRSRLPIDHYLNLSGADLTRADLRYAKLRCINFSDAKLELANLIGAKLMASVFQYADLSNALVADAKLNSANLVGANFEYAWLKNTDWAGANVRDAILTGADLSGANFTEVTNLTQQQLNAISYDPNDPPALPSGLIPPEPPQETKGANGDAPPSES